jgi:tetratricopeptide (TPR) repeat protein
MELDRTYRPRRRRQGIFGRFWPLFLLIAVGIVLYEQQPTWLSPAPMLPTPVPTRGSASYVADVENALALGNYDIALAAYGDLSRLEPQNVDPLIAQSELSLILQEPQGALALARQAVAINDKSARALTALARALNWNNQNQDAINAALDAQEIEPDNVTTLAVLAEIYTDEGNFDLAADYLNQVLEREPENLLALRNQAYLYERRADYESAIKTLERAIALAPKRFDLYMEKGRIYRVGLLDYENANQAYAQAAGLYKSAVTLDAQGDTLYNSGNYLQATRVLKEAVGLNRNYGWAHVHYGMALYARRNYEDAAPALEIGLRLVGDRARIEHLYTLGLAYIYKEPRDCAKAIPWLNKALEVDPAASAALDGLVLCNQPVEQPQK